MYSTNNFLCSNLLLINLVISHSSPGQLQGFIVSSIGKFRWLAVTSTITITNATWATLIVSGLVCKVRTLRGRIGSTRSILCPIMRHHLHRNRTRIRGRRQGCRIAHNLGMRLGITAHYDPVSIARFLKERRNGTDRLTIAAFQPEVPHSLLALKHSTRTKL